MLSLTGSPGSSRTKVFSKRTSASSRRFARRAVAAVLILVILPAGYLLETRHDAKGIFPRARPGDPRDGLGAADSARRQLSGRADGFRRERISAAAPARRRGARLFLPPRG